MILEVIVVLKTDFGFKTQSYNIGSWLEKKLMDIYQLKYSQNKSKFFKNKTLRFFSSAFPSLQWQATLPLQLTDPTKNFSKYIFAYIPVFQKPAATTFMNTGGTV